MDAPDPSRAAVSRVAVHGTLLAVQVAFASLAVGGKLVFRALEPGALALVRLGATALVFAVIAWRSGGLPRIPARDVARIAGCAALGIFGNQVLFLYGLRETTAVNAALLVATIPVFTVTVAIVTRREAARPRTIAGVGIAFAGVVWLVAGDLELGTATVIGDLLVVANSIVYAIYLVLVRDLVGRYGAVPVVTIGFGFGTLFALPVGAVSLVEQAPAIEADVWWLVLYLVLVPTVFTYLANAWALRHAASSVVAIYIYAQPPVAAALAWAFLGEVPSGRIVVTAVAVFAGIWLTTRVPQPPAPATGAAA